MLTEVKPLVSSKIIKDQRDDTGQDADTRNNHKIKIRILIINRKPMICSALAALISLHEGFEVVETAANCAECCSKTSKYKPDVLLFDIETGNNCNAEPMCSLRDKFPSVPAIVLHEQAQDSRVIGAARMGIQGYLTINALPDELFRAIHVVANGGSFFDSSVQSRVMELMGVDMIQDRDLGTTRFSLSKREYAILEHMAAGESNQTIADALFISRSTVKHYVSALLAKLKVSNRTEAVRKSIDLGLLEN